MSGLLLQQQELKYNDVGHAYDGAVVYTTTTSNNYTTITIEAPTETEAVSYQLKF